MKKLLLSLAALAMMTVTSGAHAQSNEGALCSPHFKGVYDDRDPSTPGYSCVYRCLKDYGNENDNSDPYLCTVVSGQGCETDLRLDSLAATPGSKTTAVGTFTNFHDMVCDISRLKKYRPLPYEGYQRQDSSGRFCYPIDRALGQPWCY